MNTLKIVTSVVIFMLLFLLNKLLRNKFGSKLATDIPIASRWIIDYFKKENNIDLDYSIESVKFIDQFIEENSSDGSPKENSKLSDKLGYKLFAMSSYIGEVIIKNSTNSKWKTDDNDKAGELNIAVEIGDGIVFPGQKIMKRMKNGNEDGLYGYVYLVLKNNN